VHIDPALVQLAVGGVALPFVARPVCDLAGWPRAMRADLWGDDADCDELARTDLIAAAAQLLAHLSSTRARAAAPLALAGLWRVRERLAAAPATPLRMEELERVADLDRWALARQFRAAFGTSPRHFRTQRQLDHERRLLRQRASLAQAASAAAFADQSHMTRRFKRAYGVTPAQWTAAPG
jgi:AraC-like DNA-binding protein